MKKNLPFSIKDSDYPDDYLETLSFDKSCVPAEDIAKIIGCKTRIYLDIYQERSFFGGFYLLGCFAATGIFAMMVMLFTQGIDVILSNPHYWYIAFLLSTPLILMGVMLIYYCLIPPEPPCLRFNRQRRQVYVRPNKGVPFFINWDELIPVYRFSTGTRSAYGSSLSKSLTLYMRDPKSTSGYRAFYNVFCDHRNNVKGSYGKEKVLRQWECIRGFMEDGKHACPDSVYNCTYPDYGYHVNARFINWIMAKKHPTFNKPEVLEWSKPVVRNQNLFSD